VHMRDVVVLAIFCIIRTVTKSSPYTGTCTGIVVNTGDRTVMGRIARLTGSIVEEST